MRGIKQALIILIGILYVYLMFVPEQSIQMFAKGIEINHNYFVIVFSLVIVITYIIKKERLTKQLLAITFFCVYVVLNTILNAGDIGYTVLMQLRILSFCYLMHYVIKSKLLNILRALLIGLDTIIILNMLSIVFNLGKTSALGKTFFLGFDNGNVTIILPTLLITYMYCYIINKNDRSPLVYFSWILTVASLILIGSAASTVGLVVFAILMFSKKYDIIHLINKRTMLVAIGLVFFLVIVLRLQSIFSGFVVGVLGKDLSFTGRVALWDKAIRGVSQNYLFGHGVNPTAQRAYFFGVSSAHNEVLDMLYQDGIVGFLLYLNMFYQYMKNRRNRIEANLKSFSSKLDMMVFSFLLIMQFESYNSYIGYSLILSLLVISSDIRMLNWPILKSKPIRLFSHKIYTRRKIARIVNKIEKTDFF